MGLAFIDVAGFRQFQHEHGHEVGDTALRCVAAAIPIVEPREWAGRYGGDEFAALLGIAERSQAGEWADAARAQIAASIARTLSLSLDMQIGIAVGEPGWWPSDIFRQAIAPADAALHTAIHDEARHRVVVTDLWSGD